MSACLSVGLVASLHDRGIVVQQLEPTIIVEPIVVTSIFMLTVIPVAIPVVIPFVLTIIPTAVAIPTAITPIDIAVYIVIDIPTLIVISWSCFR
jgi:hypothetical protein